MMDAVLYNKCISVLTTELKPALGCTEPIAIAYAAAKAREILGIDPDAVQVCCSGNVVKNVKGVYVPNSGGMKGIDVAAMLGAFAGRADKELEVLNDVSEEDINRVKNLLNKKICKCILKENTANLYISVFLKAGDQSSEVELTDGHTNITKILHNGQVLFEKKESCDGEDELLQFKRELTIDKVLEFAKSVKIEDVSAVLDAQIKMNTAISDEGLKNAYGSEIGKRHMNDAKQDVRMLARARAAAGSDARMNGCALPVVINSGSGNQGITVTMPVLTYAEHLNVEKERLYRALVISNLVALHQKAYIGSLSAFCGAVSAAAGSAAAITYLYNGSDEQIAEAVVNTLANVGGMVCDGAKSSCAAKISIAVESAIMGMEMSLSGRSFVHGDGIIKNDAEKTIQSVGRMARDGMKSTDVEILNIMIED